MIQGFRLSPQQRRIFLLQQPEVPGFRAECTVEIGGELAPDVLRRAIERIVERHQILRTVFRRSPGLKVPLQVVEESRPPLWQCVDLTGLETAAQERRLGDLLAEEEQRPFDLANGPMLRATFSTLCRDRHLLHLSLPAQCADGHSLRLLVREIGRSCSEILAGQAPADDEVVQYVQFSEWQNELLAEGGDPEGERFWSLQRLSDLPAPALPFARDLAGRADGAAPLSTAQVLGQNLAGRIAAAAGRLEASFAGFLLAGWQALLFRLSGQPEVGMAFLGDGRKYAELREVLGLFSRWLPVRCRCAEDLPFREHLRRVESSMNEACEWQESLPWSQSGDGEDEAPAFPVGFDFAELTSDEVAGGLRLAIAQQRVAVDRLRLRLACTRREDLVVARFEFDPDLFDHADVDRLAEQYRALLESAAETPEAAVGDLEILGAAERQRLLIDLNHTERPDFASRCVHHWLVEQAARTPDRTAVMAEGTALTFAELDARAAELALRLRALGVAVDHRVALFLERSPEMVVGLLGVLKAGGAYLPLDLSYPPGRLSGILADAGVAVLLTRRGLADRVPAGAPQVLFIDVPGGSPPPGEAPAALQDPESLAYVIYTSGSTGRPKGVMIPHRAAVSYLAWSTEAYAVEGGEGAPVHSPLGFDLTVTSLLGPLVSGRRVELVPEEQGIEGLSNALRQGGGFSLIKITPAHLEVLRQLLPAGEAAGRAGALVIGGEALTGESLGFWRAYAPATRLINEYGPTEATVGCCVYEVPAGPLPAGAVPIGRPIANARIYLVSSRLRPVSTGVPGEILIGGMGLARGYLGRPELTAEKLIPDPFGGEPGGRLYRTGDLARHRPDGQIEFIGRIDHQVKVRGFRVELEEISAVLGLHQRVRESVAAIHQDMQGDRRLVTYWVPAGSTVPDETELRAFLRERLPDYMVPTLLVKLQELPLTPNGKVDRSALPAPELAARSGREGTLPRTMTEEMLAEIWGRVLGLEQVRIGESFFEQGGHSLLAAQLVSRVRQVFGIEISLRQLFDAPTVAALAEVLETGIRSQNLLAAPPLVPVPREGPAPLSFAQQRLWFIDQLQPGSSAYNLPLALLLLGRLDVTALERTGDEIVRRHEALRTTFASADGQPFQIIAAPRPLPLPRIDLRALPQRERDRELRRLADGEAQRSFDLATGPLFRSTLVLLGEKEHAILLNQHHIVSDGWSQGILIREVAALYEAFSARRPSPLSPLPVQYADFAHWQRRWLQGEALESRLAYWRRQLAGAPPLSLPTDRPAPPVQTFRGRTLPVRIGHDLTTRLRTLGRRHGATTFMTLLAAFQTLLHRYTGQADIVVGTPVASRNRIEIEPLIGFFVNALALRTDLSGEPSLTDLLTRVRDVVLEGAAYQDVPFERLVEALDIERDMSHQPLFQVVLAVENLSEESPQMPGLELRPLGSEGPTAKFSLTLLLRESQRDLDGMIELNTDLFDTTTILRLAGHFRRLLEGIVERPEAALGELPLVPETERHQLLHEWNDTASSFPAARLESLFEAQAARVPEALAVLSAAERLSYGELDARANRLAHHLRALGIGPGGLVAVAMPRDAGMLVAVLGILKAGAAYVPLDASFPVKRMAWILSSLAVPCLVTRAPRLSVAAELAREAGSLRHIVCLDPATDIPAEAAEGLQSPTRLWTATDLAVRSAERPSPLGGPEAIAYVIFTSGSTGTPKGVVVCHRPVANLIHWVHRTFGFGPADRVLFVTSLSFDLSVYDIFGLLAAGGSVWVASEEEVGEPGRLVRLLRGHGITYWDSAPAALQQLAPFFPEAAPGEEIGGLRLVFLSGDWIPVTLPDRVRASFPGAQVVSLGGATEATVWSNIFPVRDVPPHWASIPYGRPIQNARYHVLDERLAPCPAGVAGDLFIGGQCLASGYAAEPVLTAQKFIPDPFGGEAGARLYRTGDRARFWSDGNLQFLGRLDHQVKIRGFRIELGEIATVLSQHPSVGECVVVVREEATGDRRLVAYVVPAPGGEPDAAELRVWLRERLPEHMVPAAFVTLGSWPVTANGKLDRAALPAPGGAASEDEGFVAPRTQIEELLAGIWSEVLGRPRIGARDDFFELGGHSLLATQVISRVRRSFDVELPLRTLFEAPGLAELAERIAQATRTAAGPELPPLVPVPRRGALPLSFAQQRLWLIHQLDPLSPAYNIPVGTRLRGPLDTTALAWSLGEVVARHESLRTTFVTVDGEPLQVIAPAGALVLPVLDLSGLEEGRRGEQAEALARDEAQRPFDLSTGPLLRVLLLRLGAEDHVLLATMHHAISDGWSMLVLVRELTAFYSARTAGAPVRLPDLPIQYADFAAWQRDWLRGEVLAAELAYWRRRLAGAPALLALPTDRPRPAVQAHAGAQHDFALPPELSRAAAELARRRGATLFMTLLAAFQVLLARSSGQDDISVGTPIAGRNRLETESLIGFFVNTLVLRADLSGDPGFSALLDQVRRVSLEAYAHQDLPFEKLVEELRPERSLSHTPLFQVIFALQHAAPGDERPSGLALSPYDSETGVAKFDLALRMADRGGVLCGTIEHRRDLFLPATIGRMIAHLELLLAGAVADPERPLSSISLLAPTERRQLLDAWSGESPDLPVACLHELFEARVARDPGAVALIYGDERVSYADLNRRGNQLARYLRRRGIGPGDRIAVCLERSVEMVVAVLGALKSGAAYVAVDPFHPPARRDHVLRETACRIILTGEGQLGDASASSATAVCIDRIGGEVAAEEPDDLAPAAGPGDLAYIVYTSGSTGQPKGILAHHGGAVGYLAFILRRYGIGPADTALQLAGLPFDASVRDLLGPLVAGARVVIVASAEARDPQALLAHIERSSVTCLPSVVPSLLQQLNETATSLGRVYPTVRLILTSGEALRLADCAQARRVFGEGLLVVNQYGPTECTMTSTYHFVQPADQGEVAGVGQPVAGAGIRLLDRRLEPVGVGIPGELCITGAGLAFGYLGHPDRTAAAFLPDVLGSEPGARLYRTGDLARCRSDGALELLGRIDHQVKVRGFRVEPGEVEAALRGHPRVRDAAVTARGGGADRYLAAYVVPAGEVEAGDLRAFLRESLPEYMVPAAFVRLPALPLTPNGKIDRRALPEPDRASEQPAGAAPRSASERAIAAIWSDLLGRPHLGVDDNFFELGGHSLLAMRAVNRIRQALSVDLPLRALFEEPTVAALAERVERLRPAGISGAPDAIVPLPRDGRSFHVSFAQERLWLQQQLNPESGNYNLFMAVRLEGPLNATALEESFQEIVRRHEALRTTFGLDARGDVVQTIAPCLRIDIPLTDLGSLRPDEGARLAREIAHAEAGAAFDLARDPMLRCRLLRLGTEEHVLILAVHHIAGDRWSIRLLVRELVALYGAFSSGAPSPLAGLPVQYADYAAWQRERLQGELLDRCVDFWRRQLAGARELELPADRPFPAVPSLQAGRESFELSSELTRKLKDLGERAGGTMFMTLLAGLQCLLGRLAGQTDVVVGIEPANRDRVETEGLIGFLVNQLALRVDLGGGASFREVLGRSRRSVLDAYSHQELPFQQIVSILQPERAAGRVPFIRVIFNFEALAEIESASRALPALPDLKVTELPIGSALARFDLTLRMVETRQGLAGEMEYATDLFEAATVRRVNASFRTLLENVVEEPDVPLEEIEITPEDERLRRAEMQAERREAQRSRFRKSPRPVLASEEAEP